MTTKPETTTTPPTEAEREMAEATEYYYRLQPGAVAEYNKYIQSRTPSYLQDEMNILLAPDLPKIMVSDTQPVRVCDASGVDLPGSPGTARAVTGTTGYIELIQPAGALVKDGDAVTPVDQAEGAIPYSGTAKVDGSTLVHVKLTPDDAQRQRPRVPPTNQPR